ncbi:hypothetical protein GALL_529010 [mine drainage metagenome]|uniref:Uncharacterized protein n=1 Tax=mine drainage metagenome TaxID=410659 RepID=A0A1J5P383_9ZZZZ
MALATPKEVMTQVPCDELTPRSPAMAGIDTLAIDVSSTFMKVASDSAMVPSTSALPLSGTMCVGIAGLGGGAAPAAASSMSSVVAMCGSVGRAP